MRLVDAEEAYKVLTDYYHHKTEIQHDALKEAIERVHTVDAVEVVRCKDCKWYRNANDKYFPRTCDHWSEMFFYYEGWESVDENGFCAWGAKTDEVEE